MINSKNKILIWPILYIMAMGAANLAAHFIFRTNYASPQYIKAMFPFLIIMALGTILCFYRQRNKLQEEWKGKANYGLFLLLFLPNLGMALFFIINTGSFDSAFLIPLLVTFFVGLAEEMMFRRILFVGLLKEMNFTKALLLSSIVFSLLHSVNVFAGLQINEMLIQLATTFLAGLYYALMYHHTQNIYLTIVSHWLWDYVLLSGATAAFPLFGPAMAFLGILQLVATVYLKFKNTKI